MLWKSRPLMPFERKPRPFTSGPAERRAAEDGCWWHRRSRRSTGVGRGQKPLPRRCRSDLAALSLTGRSAHRGPPGGCRRRFATNDPLVSQYCCWSALTAPSESPRRSYGRSRRSRRGTRTTSRLAERLHRCRFAILSWILVNSNFASLSAVLVSRRRDETAAPRLPVNRRQVARDASSSSAFLTQLLCT